MPGLSKARFGSVAIARMRTGNRRTILVKLPVALSAGTSANSEPEAGPTACT